MPGDIFGLRTNSSKLYDKQVDNTWPESANYGYFGGGSTPGPVVCTIDRIDFSNETVSLPGSSLTRAITNTISTSGSDYGYGYFGGGFPGVGVTDEVDRIDFSNETVAVPPVGSQLTQARNALAGVSGSDYGYYAGGSDPALTPDRVCTIDRIDFSSETVAVPPVGSQLTQARNALEGVFSSNYGYFAGGDNPISGGYKNTIDRIDFFTETTVAPGNNLTKTISTSAGVSGSDYGYFAGGSSPPYVCTIDRIDFSSETVLEIGGTLYVSRQGSAGVFSSNYGYFGGGFDGSRFCTIDRIDFSNETVTAPGTYQLTQARNSVAGVSGRQTRIKRTTDKTGSSVSGYGFYLMNGLPSGSAPGQRNIIDYATETQTTPPVDMAGTAQPHGSIFTSIDYGYQVKTGTTILDRYEFKNDTRSALDKLSAAGTGSSFSNNHYGYSTRQNETNGNRYDKSTDTDTIIANIIAVSTTRTQNGVANFSSPYYGWFSMGQTPGLSPIRASIIDRLEFSTETTSSAPVPTTYRTQATAGGKDLVGSYGYIFGGSSAYTGTYLNVANKFDMETETFSPGGTYCPAPAGRIDLTVALSKHYGYIGPGFRLPTTLNQMDRYEFSTNTGTTPSTTMSSPSVRASHCFPSDIAV